MGAALLLSGARAACTAATGFAGVWRRRQLIAELSTTEARDAISMVGRRKKRGACGSGVDRVFGTHGMLLGNRLTIQTRANAVAQRERAVQVLPLLALSCSMSDAVSVPRAVHSAVAGVLAAFEMQSCSATARDHEPRMLANAVGRAAPCVCVCFELEPLCAYSVCVCFSNAWL